MFLEKISQIPGIVLGTGFTVFALPKTVDMSEVRLLLGKAIFLQPNEKKVISIDEVREAGGLVRTKQVADLMVAVLEAEKFSENAANAFLKMLEEPGENVHYAFFTYDPARILATVRSRAQNYVLRDTESLDDAPVVETKIMELAKRLIAAGVRELPGVAADITKDKVDARGRALAVVDAAIQVLYKSYFKTGNAKFLDKLAKLLEVQVGLEANGHVKLQLIACML